MTVHDNILLAVAMYFHQKGMTNIQVDHLDESDEPIGLEFSIPDYIIHGSKRFRPDLTATVNPEESVLLEVETDDSLQEAETKDQLQAFSKHCEDTGTTMVVAIPESAAEDLDSLKNALGINCEVMTFDT